MIDGDRPVTLFEIVAALEKQRPFTFEQAVELLRLHAVWLKAKQAIRDGGYSIENLPPRELLDALHRAEMDRELCAESIGCLDIRDAESVVLEVALLRLRVLRKRLLLMGHAWNDPKNHHSHDSKYGANAILSDVAYVLNIDEARLRNQEREDDADLLAAAAAEKQPATRANNQSSYEKAHGLVGKGAYRTRHSWQPIMGEDGRPTYTYTCRYCGIGPYEYGHIPKDKRGPCPARLGKEPAP